MQNAKPDFCVKPYLAVIIVNICDLADAIQATQHGFIMNKKCLCSLGRVAICCIVSRDGINKIAIIFFIIFFQLNNKR